MVYFEKSQPAPASLALRKSYREEDVVSRLYADFKNKCYLCESKAPLAINVEHFTPHRGDNNLKYDWNNLFYVCAHCNNTKEMVEGKKGQGGLLNCTCLEDRVDERISYHIDAFPKTKVILAKAETPEASYSTRVENTISLLDAIYNGYNTPIKEIEAENIREALLNEISSFQELLMQLLKTDVPAEKDLLIEKVRDCLKNHTAFAAFKRWIVRDHAVLRTMIEM